MSTGAVDIRLRPLRLAFIVSPSDKQSLLKAIQISSSLWGGIYNPIVPLYRRTPKIWGDKFARNISGKDIVRNYIKAFDPDFIVPIGQINLGDHQIPSHKIVNPDEIVSGMEEDGTPRYGVGILEILRHFYVKELKFLRKEPLEVIFPQISPQFNIFLASFLGMLPKKVDELVIKNFDELANIDRPLVTINNYLDNFSARKIFPRRLTMIEINPLRINLNASGQYIFLMDASHSLDVIDYWNLRAIGRNVLPIANQICTMENVKSLAVKFIDMNFTRFHHKKNILDTTIILKGRSVSDYLFDSFVASLEIPKPIKQQGYKYSTQRWYPRFWDNLAREDDGVGACRLEVKEEHHEFEKKQNHIYLRTIDPDFAARYGGHGSYRYANEIDIRLFGGDGELYAEVFPSEIENVARAIGVIGFDEWRISEEGLVYFPRFPKWRMNISPPLAKNIMTSWLKNRGWSVNLSSPGRIAYQMLKQVGGSWGLAILTIPGLIELLNKTSEGKSLLRKAFWAKLQKITNEDKFASDPKGLLRRLTELKAFQLGVDIQCPVCQQHSWYTLSEIDYDINCPKCLNQFDVPSYSPDEIKWSYRSFGSFSLPRQAFGVYSVLLTYYFFARILDGATTPLMSFEASNNNVEIEADLALFYKNSMLDKTKKELMFAECKTFNRFEKKDVERMKLIAKKFPGSVIVFSTFNASLTKKEKEIIIPLAKQGRKYRKDGRMKTPVLILTSTELFSHIHLHDSYKSKKGRHAIFGELNFELRNIRVLCDITQQLYLDMEPRAEELNMVWEKRAN